MLEASVRAAVRDVPDFPSPGVLFRDITPLLADHRLLADVIATMAAPFRGVEGLTHVVGIESRGFLFGVPIALALGVGFVPMRKPGRLPRATYDEPYALEYGEDRLQMHRDALRVSNASSVVSLEEPRSTARVLLVDDVLATGGTIAAAERLVARAGARVIGVSVLIELPALEGRGRVASKPLHTVVAY